jgi:ABC-type uncharacterized transport system involved in gliding motility auxiliary subunit
MGDKNNSKATIVSRIRNSAVSFFKGILGDMDSREGNFILIIVLIILVNIVGVIFPFRFDLTLNDSFSLSPISKKVVRSLEEPLTIKVFFSNDLPAEQNSTHRYLLDLLEEYNIVANSNFHYELVDMNDPASKDIASGYGISPIQVREVDSDQMKQRNAYMGLAIIHGDLIEQMSDIVNDDGLEYKITNRIRKMIEKNDTLQAVKDPIKVTLYVSGELKGFGIQGFEKVDETVQGAFDKVNAINYKKLQYNAVDPSVTKSTAEIATKYGLQKLVWKEMALKDGKRIPAGEGLISIVVERGDRFQVVQLGISPTIFGRYVITGLDTLNDRLNDAVSGVITQHPVVGYVVGHGEKPVADEQRGGPTLKTSLEDMYEVNEIDLAKSEISEKVKTLIFNGSMGKFTDSELYKIDQFMMKGGNVLFLLDSFNEVQMQGDSPFGPQMAYIPVDTGLQKIISGMGVTVNRDYVLDVNCFIPKGGPKPIYFAPLTGKNALNQDSEITKYMKKLLFLKASSLTVNDEEIKKAGLVSTVLVRSSNQAWKMEGQINLNPIMMAPPVDPKTMSRFDLAVLVEGKLKSVFAGVKPVTGKPKEAGSIISDDGLKESAAPVKVIIIGSSDIARSDVLGQFPNGVFLHNSVDYLNGTTELAAMRSKSLDFNPIDVTTELVRFMVKTINIIFVPLLAIFAGIIVWRWRIKRRKLIQATFGKEETHE